MAQFTIFRSSDGGAPVLDGTVGSLVNLLTTVLTGPSFNGTGFAYGTTPCAGWSRVFTGTDKAVYRPGAGTRFYLRVQDDAPVTAKEARVTGYETMSDVDTGTGSFPTAAQALALYTFASAYLVCRKSTAANGTARTWVLFADSRTFYLFLDTGDIAGFYTGMAFGDFYSFKVDDAYNCLLMARRTENNSISAGDFWGNIVNSLGSVSVAHFMPRAYTQLGDAVNFGRHCDGVKLGAHEYLAGVVPFTNPEDGGIYLSPNWIHDPVTIPAGSCRGRMRGFWTLLHPDTSVAFGDTFSGGASGELAGKTFEAIAFVINQATSGGVAVIETSNSLESN